MKWTSHRVVAFAAVAAGTHGDWLAAAFAAAGSVLPDWLEFRLLPTASLRAKFHRTWTHWLLGYVLAWWALGQVEMPGQWTMAVDMLRWVIIGCAAHVLADAPCGSVAALLPWRRMRICPRLFTVGSAGEYVVVAAVVGLCTFTMFC